jgi:hypothetical protein
VRHPDLDLTVDAKSIAFDFRDCLAEVLLQMRAAGEKKRLNARVRMQGAKNRELQPVLRAIPGKYGNPPARHRRSSRIA